MSMELYLSGAVIFQSTEHCMQAVGAHNSVGILAALVADEPQALNRGGSTERILLLIQLYELACDFEHMQNMAGVGAPCKLLECLAGAELHCNRGGRQAGGQMMHCLVCDILLLHTQASFRQNEKT
jgi:hypothetical protein